MIIREMLPRELDSVLNLFNYYADDAGITDETFDADRLRHTVREYCIRPNLFFRVCYNGQRPVGVIGGFLSDDPVERTISATIQFHYLLPECADINNYQQMIDAFESWATECQAQQIRVIDIGHRLNRLHDIYDQLGYAPVRLSIMNKEII